MTDTHKVMTRQSEDAFVTLADDGEITMTVQVGPRTFDSVRAFFHDGPGITPFKVLNGDGFRVIFVLDVNALEMDVNY